MALSLVYRDEATDDIAEAMRWYRSKQDGLDERFLLEVLACEAMMLQFPKGAAVVYKRFRQVLVKGFPYVMVYGVRDNGLIVYRVFHTSQHPKKKFKKRK
ncbi:MAG: type II toxin-antitoxin system RelE/ParE family toxin [Flavobacteriales bacterium]|nr:type II toxin-antitoxin system RelE/ParE family toxin [Flavobacteriales bacterium]